MKYDANTKYLRCVRNIKNDLRIYDIYFLIEILKEFALISNQNSVVEGVIFYFVFF